jgi:hypothetical protein
LSLVEAAAVTVQRGYGMAAAVVLAVIVHL